MITYLKKLQDERDQLTAHATSIAEKAAAEERDLTDTEQNTLREMQTRCAVLDGQLTEYNAQAESQRAYARLRESITTPDEPERPSRTPAIQTNSWGDLFVESTEFRSYHGMGTSGRVEVPWDTRAEIALDDIPASLTRPYFYQQVTKSETTPLINAVANITVGGNTVEWVEWVPATAPNAPVVAEGALKPEMALSATPHSDTLDTYAHWKAITRQALEDIPQIRSIVESRLRQGLLNALDAAITTALNGGTYTGVSNADLLTGVRLGLATVQGQGYGNPNVVVLNPADLAAIDISVMGSTMSGPTLQTSAWGLSFIPAAGVAVGTAYVGDLDAAVQLFRRSTATVMASESHADYFIRNLVLLLAEIRALAVVSEPNALVEVTKTA